MSSIEIEPSRQRNDPPAPGLSFTGVSFGYQRGSTLYEGLSLDLPVGRTVLLGPNGAGKSTLLELASGGLAPRSGRITLESGQSGQSALRRHVALMPQRVRPLAGLTVVEQVTYSGWLAGRSVEEAADAARPALARVGLTALAQRRPTKISGGELRRVGLAQVLASGHHHILLDEPTAGLDPEQQHAYRAILSGLPEDLCLLVSTHDINDVAEIYDHIIVLARGSVQFTGSVRDFLTLGDPGSHHPAESAYLNLVNRSRQ